MTRHRLSVAPDCAGLRLDQYLGRQLPELSRRTAKLALDIGCVFVNGKRSKVASRKLAAGDELDVHLGGAFTRALAGETGKQAVIDFSILHEDEHIVVVNKPAGLLTAPTPEGDRNNLVYALSRRDGQRQTLFVVQRLDLQTSGVLVLAKTPHSNRVLSELFREHRLERQYDALVLGAFEPQTLRVALNVQGKHAVTHFSLQQRHAQWSWLRAQLETGRTHQIRIHAQSLGHPVLADPRYGQAISWAPPRLALHARLLVISHPHTGTEMRFEAPLPSDLQSWVDAHSAPTG